MGQQVCGASPHPFQVMIRRSPARAPQLTAASHRRPRHLARRLNAIPLACRSGPVRHGRTTVRLPCTAWVDLAARNAQWSKQSRPDRHANPDLRFRGGQGTGSNRRPCGFQSFGRVCSAAEIWCLRCSVGMWQGTPEQGLAGFSLTATLTVDARWLVRTSLRPRRNRVAYCPDPDG